MGAGKMHGARAIWCTVSWLLLAILVGGCARPVGKDVAAFRGEAAVPPAGAPTATPYAPPAPTMAIAASSTPTVAATAAPPPPTAARPTATATDPARGSPAPARPATVTPTATTPVVPTPGPTPDGVARTLRVPILMYHYVSAPPADADVYRRDLSVTPAQFESHLAYLSAAGYHTITLDDLLDALAQGKPLPPKPVILTFDDGYEDNYTVAFPLLRAHGMIGHFSILTDVVNAETPGYMTWPQIEEMAANGQRFGSHARNHAQNLSGKSVDFLVWHALGGMEAIQEHLGYHPRWITYPSGKYDAQTIAVYKSAGYWGGLTTEPGMTHTLDGIFKLKRVRIHGGTTAEILARLLEANQ